MSAPVLPLSDPSGGTPLLDAVLWVQHLLLGTIATAIAVLAVAAVGALTLTGRVPLRRAGMVVLGCFVLFGAPVIAASFVRLGEWHGAGETRPVLTPMPPQPTPSATASPVPYDPYAGAAVPVRS